MTADARFDDGAERPLALFARNPDDVPVLSALLQDAVFPVTDMRWTARSRQFSLLVNRFRWEDDGAAGRRRRPVERVRAVLLVRDVTRVVSQGIDRQDRDVILSLLSVQWVPGADGTGQVILTLAGDGAIALDAECLDLTLKDVTRPYPAPSGRRPQHPE